MLTKDYKIKKKTELCSTFMSTGSCKYGDNCAFAHGDEELRKKVHVPSMYKTKLCQQFQECGVCPYGLRCQFIHSTTLGELQKDKASSEKECDIKKHVSYKQMLHDNAECIKDRINSSQNPYLNEFNLIYKDMNTRLPIFEKLLSEKDDSSSQSSKQPDIELLMQYLSQQPRSNTLYQ